MYIVANDFDIHLKFRVGKQIRRANLGGWQQVLAWRQSIQPRQRVAVWTNSSTVQSSRQSGSCWLLLTERRAQAATRQANLPFVALLVACHRKRKTKKASGMYQRWSCYPRPVCFAGNRFNKRGHVCVTNPEVSFMVTSVLLLLLQWAVNEDRNVSRRLLLVWGFFLFFILCYPLK